MILSSHIIIFFQILKIEVKSRWRKGTKITFEGVGDEKPGYLPADIVFLIDEKKTPFV